MKIDIVYASNAASAPAGFKAAVNAAVAFVEAAFVSPITVNLTFAWASLGGAVGESETYFGSYSYAAVVAALRSAAFGYDALDDEVLPTFDPFSGSTLNLTTADARQLGLSTYLPPNDSIVTLDSSATWNFSASVADVSGGFNAVTVLIHEITEALGRSLGSDGALNPSPLALFRYAGAGVIDTSNAAGGYLSLNGGATDLVAMGNAGGDLGDYNVDGDPFGYAVAGEPNSVSAVDLNAMQAIGYNLTSGVHFGGGADVALGPGDNDCAVFFNSGGGWDTASGSGGSVLLWNDRASILGGGDSIDFYAGLDTTTDTASLYGTGGNWDVVNGSDGIVALVSAQASVVGAANLVYLDGSASDAVSLYQTADGWDSVQGSNGAIALTAAQTSVFGGADTVYFEGAASNVVSFYDSAGASENVRGSDGVVALTAAQAAVTGGADTVYFDGSASDAVSLIDTGGAWDLVSGSHGAVTLDAAQAAVVGSDDAIAFAAGSSGDAVSLYETGAVYDTVTGSGGTLILDAARASVNGGGDLVYLSGANCALTLNDAAGDWDTVEGSDASVSLASSQASVVGGGDVLNLSGDDVVSLYATDASPDTVSGSGQTVILTGASADLQGGSDTLVFAASYGLDTVAGFVSSDTICLSAADWTSFAALQTSGDLSQVGGNAEIKLDNADVLTLTNVTTSSLTAANFSFA